MAPKKQEHTWITVKEAADILTKKSGHTVTPAYVRRLGNGDKTMAPQLTTWKVDERTRLYSKEDVEKYIVRPRGDGSVRPWHTRLPRHVKLISPDRIVLQCDICGQQWSPNLLPGGRLPRNSKMCPNGCTATANEEKEKPAA
jgi:hypothetical protein